LPVQALGRAAGWPRNSPPPVHLWAALTAARLFFLFSSVDGNSHKLDFSRPLSRRHGIPSVRTPPLLRRRPRCPPEHFLFQHQGLHPGRVPQSAPERLGPELDRSEERRVGKE